MSHVHEAEYYYVAKLEEPVLVTYNGNEEKRSWAIYNKEHNTEEGTFVNLPSAIQACKFMSAFFEEPNDTDGMLMN